VRYHQGTLFDAVLWSRSRIVFVEPKPEMVRDAAPAPTAPNLMFNNILLFPFNFILISIKKKSEEKIALTLMLTNAEFKKFAWYVAGEEPVPHQNFYPKPEPHH
jgi:hypothetical protein